MSFCVIPAIDIKDGSCVRLKQGMMDEVTVYSSNPYQMASLWVGKNARRLHLVDLDGAFLGDKKNASLVKRILKEFGKKLEIQVGGGIRDIETVERIINYGASYAVIGTAAVKDPNFLEKACSSFPNKIIVSLDAKDGKVATHGWSKTTNLDVIELAKSIERLSIKNLLYTDISRDGMQTGINLDATLGLAQAVKIPVLASGGLATTEEITKLEKLYCSGIEGVILGKSLYEGNICLEKVIDQLETRYVKRC